MQWNGGRVKHAGEAQALKAAPCRLFGASAECADARPMT